MLLLVDVDRRLMLANIPRHQKVATGKHNTPACTVTKQFLPKHTDTVTA